MSTLSRLRRVMTSDNYGWRTKVSVMADLVRGHLDAALVRALQAVTDVAMSMPRNEWFYGYVITSPIDGSKYITRVITPRMFGHRLMLHHIHRPDYERHVHNHPWRRSYSLILTGGYYEERVIDHDTLEVGMREFDPGEINRIDANDFHRITAVAEDTWTLFLAGEPVQSWGFLVAPQMVVEHSVYKAATYPNAKVP